MTVCVCCCLQERLDQQRKERSEKGQSYSASFKPQRSKDEAKERRKAILSSIGEVRHMAGREAHGRARCIWQGEKGSCGGGPVLPASIPLHASCMHHPLPWGDSLH
jgi:hypothetical protein